ncbi:MAG: ribosomal protein uS13 [Candidatus Nasuia deltocephalinicola]
MKNVFNNINYYINKNFNLFSFLIKIFGIGFFRANYICKSLNISCSKKIKFLNPLDLKKISEKLSIFKIGDDLKKVIKTNINELINIKCYRGVRHLKNLPVRGQNTKNNSRTRKGPKKIIFYKKNKFNFKNVKKNKK